MDSLVKIYLNRAENEFRFAKVAFALSGREDLRMLLSLFAHEKWKRGHFTYKTIAQANVEPAKESLDNTIKFLSNLKAVLENGR